MKKILKIIGALILFLLLGMLLLFIAARKASPPQIVANFTELDKIEKISKYRSCAGHTTVPQDEREMRRSMKHYFSVKPEYLGGNTVNIYAPYDGFVAVTREDRADGLEGEIWIVPNDIYVMLPPIWRWSFSVQHINIREGLKRGSEVRAGELIGYAAVAGGNRNTFDVVYAKGSPIPKRIDNWMGPFSDLDSVFNHMSEDVFAQYQARGIESKEDFLITKEERDLNPCTYKDDGPYFLNQDDSKNWVVF
ncbi:MAG: hypothetical protein Q7R85_04125 [bacterium]|nr:hypothetical protein [bacterium]